MAQKDEINSSLKNVDFITFVGFKRHLVLRFISDNLQNYTPDNIYIFTSNTNEPLDEYSKKKEEIIQELENIANKRKINIVPY
jgi:flagellar motor protein MotB